MGAEKVRSPEFLCCTDTDRTVYEPQTALFLRTLSTSLKFYPIIIISSRNLTYCKIYRKQKSLELLSDLTWKLFHIALFQFLSMPCFMPCPIPSTLLGQNGVKAHAKKCLYTHCYFAFTRFI